MSKLQNDLITRIGSLGRIRSGFWIVYSRVAFATPI